MKKLAVILVIFALSLLSFRGLGQGIDEARMQRDIEVVEAILNELFQAESKGGVSYSSSGTFFFSNGRNKESTGVYVEDYGVIFKLLQKHQNLGYTVVDGKTIIGTSTQGVTKIKGKVKGKRVQKAESDGETIYYIITDDDDTEVGEEIELAEVTEAITKAKLEQKENIKKNVKQFFIAYADLIGQLKPSDNIMLVFQTQRDRFPSVGGLNGAVAYAGTKEENKSKNLTAEVSKADLVAFKSGKLSEEAFVKKIKFSEEAEAEKAEGLEYEVLAGVFEKLFKDNEFIYGGQRVKYHKLNNFGVIYEVVANPFQRRFSIVSSNRTELVVRDGRFETIKTPTEEDEYLEKAQKQREELITQIKEYMVQYGRTLRSLKESEVLMLDVVLNSNLWQDKDKLSKKVKLTVTKAVLNDYDKGSISFEDAVSKVKVKEY